MENITLRGNFTKEAFTDVLQRNGNWIYFTLLIVLVILTIVPNSFIVITVYQDKTMRTFINAQYVSMALANLLIGLFAMPALLIATMYGYWPLNELFCIVWCITDFVGNNVSSLCLVLVAFYQLKCIVKPFKAGDKKLSYEIVIIFLLWFIPSVFWTASVLIIRSTRGYYVRERECYFMYTFTYVMFANTIFYATPAVLIGLGQVLVYRALKAKARQITPTSVPQTGKTTTKSKGDGDDPEQGDGDDDNASTIQTNVGTKSASKAILNKSKLKKQQKAFRVLCFVATSYLILWLPWITIWPVQAYCNCVPSWFYKLTYWLQYSNSMVNSIFLIIRHQAYREKFTSIFSRKWKCIKIIMTFIDVYVTKSCYLLSLVLKWKSVKIEKAVPF